MSDHSYHLAERGIGVGVLTAEEVEAGLATGRLSATTLSWREGEAAWMPLGARPEFAPAVGAYRTLVPPPLLAFEASAKPWPGWTAWAQTLRAIWSRPRTTFARGGFQGPLRRSLGWTFLCAILVAPFLFIQADVIGSMSSSAFFLVRIGAGLPTEALRSFSAGEDLVRFLVFLAWFPPAMVGLVFGLACLLSVVLGIFGGGRGGFGVTLRVVAYVVGAWLVPAVLPCSAPLAAFGGLVSLWFSLRSAHADPAWKTSFALAAAACAAGCAAVVLMALAVWPFFRPMG